MRLSLRISQALRLFLKALEINFLEKRRDYGIFVCRLPNSSLNKAILCVVLELGIEPDFLLKTFIGGLDMGIKSTLLGAAVAAVSLTGAASAATYVVVGANAPESWDEVVLGNTTTLSPGAAWTTAPSIVNNSVGGQYKSPFDPRSANNGVDVPASDAVASWEQVEYFTVGSPTLIQSPAVMTVAPNSAFLSLLWGSVDLYNAIEFYAGGSLVETVSGADIFASGGEPAASGAAFVKISGFNFDEVKFYSNFNLAGGSDQPAFEFSNVVAAVPLPAGGLLLLTALGGLGIASRKRKKAA